VGLPTHRDNLKRFGLADPGLNSNVFPSLSRIGTPLLEPIGMTEIVVRFNSAMLWNDHNLLVWRKV